MIEEYNIVHDMLKTTVKTMSQDQVMKKAMDS